MSSYEKINYLIKLYTGVTKAYTKEYNKKFGVDYNKMIKQAIQYDILDSQREILSDVIELVKLFVKIGILFKL